MQQDRYRVYSVVVDSRIIEVVRAKLGDALAMSFPPLIRREVEAAPLHGKARAVIGMRRAGKTSFLYQCLADRLAAGIERERLVYFNFEDERLGGMEAADLGSLIEEYYREFPRFRGIEKVTWCLDEIQIVPGWESWVRRLLDSELVEVLLSGSSARLLSREVATSMRGRALETVITPFSFREFITARGQQPPAAPRLLAGQDRSRLRQLFDDYLETGGFPEASALPTVRDRVGLLQGYVDTVLFRDVAERHGVSNLPALRAFVRQLLRSAACSFSVNKTFQDFKSRGLAISKESLLAYLDHLEDAFLVFALPLASRSERRRQVNPRKLYLADHSLAAAFSPASGIDRGHLIENIVACELARYTRDLAYVRTVDGLEVDFLATDFKGNRTLVQVASSLGALETLARETRALIAASAEFPDAALLLLAEDDPTQLSLPEAIPYAPVWQWLLQTAHPD